MVGLGMGSRIYERWLSVVDIDIRACNAHWIVIYGSEWCCIMGEWICMGGREKECAVYLFVSWIA
jgi:hypothetical protein